MEDIELTPERLLTISYELAATAGEATNCGPDSNAIQALALYTDIQVSLGLNDTIRAQALLRKAQDAYGI